MKKLTRHTSIEELKASQNLLPPQQSDSERASQFSELITTLKNYSSSKQSKSNKSSNKSTGGK